MQINIHNKIMLLFSCTFFWTQAVTPFQAELITLLESTRKADHYWANIESQKTKFIWESMPWHWIWSSRKKTIAERRKQLQKAQNALAMLLGQAQEDPNELKKLAPVTTTHKAKALLKQAGIPSYLKRHWLSYSIITLATLFSYTYYQCWINNDTLFVIKSSNNIQTLLNTSCESLEYFYTKDDKQQYLRVAKKDENKFATLLNNTQNTTITKRTPTLDDSMLYFYDKNGINVIKRFYEENGIEPLVSIKKIIFKETQNDRLLAHDINHLTERFTKDLDTLIRKARQEHRTQHIVEKHIQNKSLNDVPFGIKKNILNDIVAFSHKEIPEVIKTLKIFKVKNTSSSIPYKAKLDTILSSATDALNIFEYVTAKNADFFALSFEALFLHVLQRDLQLSVVMNNSHNIMEKLKLNFEFMATIPVMVLTYATYKILRKIITKVAGIHILTPLKKDLIQFQLLLNKERHTTKTANINLTHKGMCFYWIEKLKQYSNQIKDTDKTTYNAYINQLSDTTSTPAQKITIIECMFREFEFLR